MLHGFRIVEEMKDGLSRWMDEKGYNASAISGGAVANTTDWKYRHELQVIAQINQDDCIKCGAATWLAKTRRTRRSTS
jgi:dihydropyrimidine dehydrogenase (NAD+) subunit PreA